MSLVFCRRVGKSLHFQPLAQSSPFHLSPPESTQFLERFWRPDRCRHGLMHPRARGRHPRSEGWRPRTSEGCSRTAARPRCLTPSDAAPRAGRGIERVASAGTNRARRAGNRRLWLTSEILRTRSASSSPSRRPQHRPFRAVLILNGKISCEGNRQRLGGHDRRRYSRSALGNKFETIQGTGVKGTQ
jgi:hypothetical protein